MFYSFVLSNQTAFAISNFNNLNDIMFYDSKDSGCSEVGYDLNSSGSDKSGSGIWNSGMTAPYILEQFAIETLKDVAAKKGVDPTNAVTQEHVIALVAFMFGEGGDINNNDLFNPLNTGLNAPDLIDGAHSVSGVQSFKSFDAGVEATARTIVGKNQSRLGDVLTRKDSTADQFMYALTYYSKYDGNYFWASASLPPNQDSYYHGRLSIVQQVRGRYADIAGLVLGTAEKEQINNITNKSSLVYSPTTDNSNSIDANKSTGTSGCLYGNGVVAGNIVQTAINLAWPTFHTPALEATQSYIETLNKYNPGGTASADGADCGVFVSTVMRSSGVDENYPSMGTATQLNYIKNNPDKYNILDAVSSTADMQPGDILITPAGHTFIFIGLQSNGSDEASASLKERMPSLGKSTLTDSHGTTYSRVRVIK